MRHQKPLVYSKGGIDAPTYTLAHTIYQTRLSCIDRAAAAISLVGWLVGLLGHILAVCTLSYRVFVV
jgi:hypothetical protein